MTKLIISNFEECEYDLIPFGLEGALIIEENTPIYIRTKIDDFIIQYKDDLTFEFISDVPNILNITEEQRLIIKQIIDSLHFDNSEEEEDFDEMPEVPED